MQRVFDAFWIFRRKVFTALVYYSMRFYGIEVGWDELWNEKYQSKIHTDRNLDRAGDLPLLLSEAKDVFKRAEDRRTSMTEKCKYLLTLSSLLFTAIGLLLPKSFELGAPWIRYGLFVSLLALLDSILLLVVFVAVRPSMSVAIDQSDADLGGDDIKKSLINSYLKCESDMEKQTDYLVDIYKTARFFLLSSLTIILILFSINFFFRSSNTEASQAVQLLHGDAELMRLLRGDKGDRGERGEKGEPGKAYSTLNTNCVHMDFWPLSFPQTRLESAVVVTNK